MTTNKKLRYYRRVTLYNHPQLKNYFTLKNFTKKEAEKFIQDHTDSHAYFRAIRKSEIKGQLLKEMKWEFGNMTKKDIIEQLESYYCYDNYAKSN